MTVGITIDIREKRYPSRDGHGAVTALSGFRARIEPGAFCALVGPSGCGKSTLLNIVAGLDDDFSGTVGFDPPHGPARRIGYVFQGARLLPWRTVRENVALVMPRNRARADLDALLDEVGLADAADFYPVRLSGGMTRRAALARALAIDPDLLLLDEPFVSLDLAAAERLRELVVRAVSTRPVTVLFVTHDPGEAVQLGDQILFLSSRPGRVVAEMPIKVARPHRREPAVLTQLQAEAARLGKEALAARTT
jgi:ABC-type nitrate/sulfonate/bicarbonate transport system ATPase subunit